MYDLAIAVNDWARSSNNKLDISLKGRLHQRLREYPSFIYRRRNLLPHCTNVLAVSVSGYHDLLISTFHNQEKLPLSKIQMFLEIYY